MGVLLQAECLACGHEAELFVGFGFEGVDFEPRVCHDCREIVSVPIEDRFGCLDPLRDLNHCPSCGGTNFQPFAYGALGPDETDPSARFGACPRCGASMNVYDVGMWD
jgi:hypothetical protein